MVINSFNNTPYQFYGANNQAKEQVLLRRLALLLPKSMDLKLSRQTESPEIASLNEVVEPVHAVAEPESAPAFGDGLTVATVMIEQPAPVEK